MKVLSIDLDFILEPCINLYNADIFLSNEVSLKEIWNNLDKTKQIFKYVEVSKDRIIFLANLIENILTQSPNMKVCWAEDHSAIIPFLSSMYDQSKIDLVNIDHHHDLGYSPEDNLLFHAGCGNWVKYLIYCDVLNSYTWIKNENSQVENLTPSMLTNPISLINFSTELDISNMQFDAVFITCSRHWFPPSTYEFIDKFYNIIELMPNFINFGAIVSHTPGLEYNYFTHPIVIKRGVENV